MRDRVKKTSWNDITDKPDGSSGEWDSITDKPADLTELITLLGFGSVNKMISFDSSGNLVLISANASDGYALLDNTGKLPTSLLPAIAISNVNVVANNTERDALSVETGDFARVTSTGKTFIYDGTAWIEIITTSAITSVNSLTGDVTLTTDNIAEGSTNKYHKDYRSKIFTAGENLVAGDVCRLNTATGKMVKASNSSFTNASGLIGISAGTISNNANGEFILGGCYIFSGWTNNTGIKIYLGNTAGLIAGTEPSTTGNQVRALGYCLNSTTKEYLINIDETIWEVQ